MFTVYQINGVGLGVVVLADSEYSLAIFHLLFLPNKDNINFVHRILLLREQRFLERAVLMIRCNAHFVMCMDSLGCVQFLIWCSVEQHFSKIRIIYTL